jgi:hypothetical protein
MKEDKTGIFKKIADMWRGVIADEEYEDEDEIISARQMSFSCFDRGTRPVETWKYLTDLVYEVKKDSVIHYFYDWQKKADIFRWQPLKKLWKRERALLEEQASKLGVSPEDFRAAMTNCRTPGIFLRRLGLPSQQDTRVKERKIERETEKIVQKMMGCSSGRELAVVLKSEADRLGTIPEHLIARLGRYLNQADFRARFSRLLNG